MERTRVVIMGAAGRDFHDFNVAYRNDPGTEVVAFTAATQIPGIAGRRYPAELAGPLYPDGIQIVAESELERLLAKERIDLVVFAYSDVAHEHVMHTASRALAGGADFELLGPDRTMLPSTKPVVATGATRTGAGKSQTTRYLAALLEKQGLKVVVVRHPMPYGDLVAQRVQRYATYTDLDQFLGPTTPLPSAPSALFVGVLQRYKNVDGLARAWALAAPQVPNASLRLVGKGTRSDVAGFACPPLDPQQPVAHR